MTRRRKRRPKRTWDEAMHRGAARTALVLWLCEGFGHYRRWAGTKDEVRAALHDAAASFVRLHGLPHRWATGFPVRRVWRYVEAWVECKAHRRFGKGIRWVDAAPEVRAGWWVGWEAAQEEIAMALDLNKLGGDLRAAQRRAEAGLRADHARILHSRGMPKWEIAELFECSERTIQRDLNGERHISNGGETQAT